MKLKVYKAWRDGESGEWGREFLGYVSGENEETCRENAVEKFSEDWADLRLYSVGERVKLHGWLSEEARGDTLRKEFNSMCREEQDAYMGR